MQYLGRLKKVPSGFTFPHWSLIPTPFFMVLICYISPFLLLFLAFYWLTAAIVVSVVSPFLGRTVQLCLKETDQHFCSSQHDKVGIPYIMSGCATRLAKSKQPLSHSATLPERLDQPLSHSATLAERLTQPLTHSATLSE